jgi:hypothetical protein
MANPDVALPEGAADWPADFRRAVAGLSGAGLRPGTVVAPLPAPARLAPWSYAIAVAVGGDGAPDGDDDEDAASGRMVLLHDPDGVAAWDGTLRVVVFGTCEVDAEMAADPLLSGVAWSRLTERLAAHEVDYRALGGTVTTTCSTRFGDIAGPARTDDLELRASWTASTFDTAAHLAAFADFLAAAAGLPPEGITAIREQHHPFAAHRA